MNRVRERKRRDHSNTKLPTKSRKAKAESASGNVISLTTVPECKLESVIGRQVREFRTKLQLTITQLAGLIGISSGMLSKIETGNASPSLSTLQQLAYALKVPVTAFLQKFEEEKDVTYVKAGGGLPIERRGTRAGYEYRLLGHTVSKSIAVEPYCIVLPENSEVFPLFQHDGVELNYVVRGQLLYRHGDKTYLLSEGDSLFFDANAPHGPEELITTPIKMISVFVYRRYSDKD